MMLGSLCLKPLVLPNIALTSAVFHVTDISASSSGDRDNLVHQQLEVVPYVTVLQDVRLLVERQV